MNIFFGKKYVLAALIFTSIVALAVSTLYYNYSEIKDDIRHVYDIWFINESVINKMKNLEISNKSIETAVVGNIFGEKNLFEIYGLFQRLILKNESRNFEFIKDRRGYIYSGAFYIERDKNVFEYARRVKKLADAAAGNGARTLFISYPEKSWIAKNYSAGLPIRKYDAVQDEFLTYLMNNRVDALDIRASFKKMGVDEERIYYKTDRRMTTYGSFRVFQAIVAEIQRRYGNNLDPEKSYTDIHNYSVESYPGIFLGGMAVNGGESFYGSDDFEIYDSKFKEEYKWQRVDDENQSFVKSGNKNILLDRHYIFSKDIHNTKFMEVFLGGEDDWDKITNIKKTEGPKILCIIDENFSPVAVFLAPLCSEIHLIKAKEKNADIEDYIKANDFDYVFIEFSAAHISDDYFNFFKHKS